MKWSSAEIICCCDRLDGPTPFPSNNQDFVDADLSRCDLQSWPQTFQMDVLPDEIIFAELSPFFPRLDSGANQFHFLDIYIYIYIFIYT